MTQRNLIAACLLAAGLLAACGGGDDDSPAPAAPLTAVPASAGATADAYTQFGVSQAAASSETAEPLSLDAIAMPPTSDTTEPQAL